MTPVLLGALALRPGERVLDVGCGAGAAALRAADAVGGHGAVRGVDVSPACIELATRRAALARRAQVSFQAGDAQTAAIDGGPFDAAMSQFGVMFFADPVAAFANIRRHLVPGGRLCFSCWGDAGGNPWSFAADISDLLPPAAAAPPRRPLPGPFSLADRAHLRQVLHAAGFGEVGIHAHSAGVDVPEMTVVDDGELAVMGVPAERLPEARERAASHFAPYRLDAGLLRLPLAYSVVTAR